MDLLVCATRCKCFIVVSGLAWLMLMLCMVDEFMHIVDDICASGWRVME